MTNLAIIGITDWAETERELDELGRKLDAREVVLTADYHLNFATATQLLTELPPRRLDTLRAIKASGGTSIYAVAKAMGRNYSNVHADVQKLIEHGLVEKDEGGHVFVPFDDVLVRVNASLLEAA